jgi:hypothetical protein
VSVVALSVPASAFADAGSLYTGPGPRPGPDILYAPLASAPQLQNTGVWTAAPILVSGASAYRHGEFLYPDFLYDDHGARGLQRDQNDAREAPGGSQANGDLFAAPNGTYTYPTDKVYAGNAADLVELRVKPLADATAFRITLNTLKDPQRVGITIAIGDSAVALPYPHGANVRGPAQMFLTVHGGSADLLDAVTQAPVGGRPPTVSIDMARRQLEVRVPHTAWNPTGQTVRLAGGVGLWNTAANQYLIPQSDADATRPGGASGLATPPAFFNVLFRYNGQEPFPKPDTSAISDPAWWRDKGQAAALTAGDISQFFATVNFNRLAAVASDDMPGQPKGVPQVGGMDRILASHFETAQGTDYSVGCGGSTGCKGELVGQLQPYGIYIPTKPRPHADYGLTLLLHSLSASYNQFLGSNNQSQFGERGPGSIIVTPSGRGLDSWYYEYGGADTFEAWADVAARYKLDPAYTAIAGYSMGGYGTYKFATQFPDLFAKAQPTVGPPGLGIWVPPADPTGGAQSNTNRQLASVRNIPFLIWVQATDELVPIAGTEAQARTFDSLGYRYEFDIFNAGEHVTLATNDQFQPAADFLGTTKVDRDPPHVSYVYNPTMDFPGVGTAAGHAYWVGALRLRNGSGTAPLGSIDARSRAFGVGDPKPSGTQFSAGVLTGGAFPAIPFTSQTQTWGPTPATPASNTLDITARNLSSAHINMARARLDCAAQLNVDTDGPFAVNPDGCGHSIHFAKGGCVTNRFLHLYPRRRRGARVTRVVVSVNGKQVKTVNARRGQSIGNIRLDLRKFAPGTLKIKLKVRSVRRGRTSTRTDKRTYRRCAQLS